MIKGMDSDKVKEARIEACVEAMREAMLLVDGITVQEMVSAALRLCGRTVRTALQQSSDDALLRNEEILRGCLQNVMLEAVSDNRSTVH